MLRFLKIIISFLSCLINGSLRTNQLFHNKDTIFSHMDKFNDLKSLKIFVSISFFKLKKLLKSSFMGLNI